VVRDELGASTLSGSGGETVQDRSLADRCEFQVAFVESLRLVELLKAFVF